MELLLDSPSACAGCGGSRSGSDAISLYSRLSESPALIVPEAGDADTDEDDDGIDRPPVGLFEVIIFRIDSRALVHVCRRTVPGNAPYITCYLGGCTRRLRQSRCYD
ncbi:hypothetical protein PWT90_03702 [Aphanocladium album]|nr:hypothetical protein PWT90_03702 [Aphanocladium album]